MPTARCTKIFIWIVVLTVFAVAAFVGWNSAHQPLVVALAIEGPPLCDAATANTDIKNVEQGQRFCRQRGENGAPVLIRLLDALEPSGPAGQVQLGYAMGIPLLALYQKTDSGWVIDETMIDDYLNIITQVPRPMVLFFLANHFDSYGPLVQELGQDPDNLMQLADGKSLELNYFGYSVMPWTLSSDLDIAVNHYRFAALEHVARKIQALPRKVRKRIIAYTLAGELHHLFPDFAGGMGVWNNIKVTDYSLRSIADFRQWLQAKYQNIAQLNAQTGLDYPNFDAIPAPGKDIRHQRLESFGEHYDAWADGMLPIAGWLWDPQQTIERLDVYLDGEMHASMPRGFNRLDVYRALEEVTDPNIGFRYDLDFSRLSLGMHMVQVVAEAQGQQYQVGQAEFTLIARDQSSPSSQRANSLQALDSLESLQPQGVRAWLDMPTNGQDLYYNPLAREWNAWRRQQVYDFLQAFHTHARRVGLPAKKLYSHQIIAEVNSSWNHQLMASADTLDAAAPWKPGLNLYGGAVNSYWLRRWMRQRGVPSGYGVPEFHPQQWKHSGIHLAALQAHYAAGARFIAPYYLPTSDVRFKDQRKTGDEVNRMELAPDNPKDGSDQFYRAITEFVRQ